MRLLIAAFSVLSLAAVPAGASSAPGAARALITQKHALQLLVMRPRGVEQTSAPGCC